MRLRSKDIKEIDFPCDCLVLSVAEPEGISPYKEIDDVLGGTLSDIIKSGTFRAKQNETHIIHPIGRIKPKAILLVGLGKSSDITGERLRQAGGVSATAISGKGFKRIALSTRFIKDLGLEPSDFAEGAVLASYRFRAYKKEEDPKNIEQLTILTEKDITEALRYVTEVASGVYLARDLINTPSNDMTPTGLLRAARSLSGGKVSVKVIERKEAERLGMGAYLSVAKGSDEPPKFIVISYKGSNTPPLVIIGKSITFDSGGISIKPSEGMEKMKYDMAGGAAVLGIIKAASSLKLRVNLIGILPSAENLPGGHASKPGDIVRAIDGRTIEIISTDAEGRLTLADAIAYAKRFKPEAIIDIATLTGACSICLGNEAIAMMGNDDSLMEELKRASDITNERLWQMPLYDEYKEYIKSDIADIKNSGGKTGSLVTAGYFLKEFAGDTRWVHLDIAGTAWAEKDKPYCPKGATGVAVRLILRMLSGRHV